MMVLLAAAPPDRVTARLVENGSVLRSAEAEGKGETLRLVAALLPAKQFSRLTGIVVSMTGGSFSHVRSAAAVANTLGFGVGVPVLGVRHSLPHDAKRLRTLEARLRRLPRSSIARPAYGSEPHITLG